LPADDRLLTKQLLSLLVQLLAEIDSKNSSIANLQRIIFGPKSERRRTTQKSSRQNHSTNQSTNQPLENPADEASATTSTSSASTSSTPINQSAAPSQPGAVKKRRPGHGRLGTADFPGAKVVVCLHQNLQPGDRCPLDCTGKLRDTKDPLIFIRREARPIIDAIKYQRQVLRCSFCEKRFTAQLPEGISLQKYDESADVMIALIKYGSALPWYRLEKLQLLLGVPLPAGTQFERCEIVANSAHPIYLELKRQAAKSGLLHGDDTSVRILSLMAENKQLSDNERKGMHTTGIGSRSEEFDIAIYCSGRKYCGENLDELLTLRPDDLTEPILMADAENKNWSKKFKVIIAKCLAHARRKFVNCQSAFQTECGVVLDKLAAVYNLDAQTRDMTAGERLSFHQEHSKPIMDELKQYLTEQVIVHKKEPNGAFGRAIKYMLKHWPYLTRFLEVAGCPLDNNYIERSLRRAVILRKNSLFYQTEHGAAIGDVLTSIIETCALNGINAFDYLMALMKNKKAARANPEQWLPWTYPTQLAA
jgi:transposase